MSIFAPDFANQMSSAPDFGAGKEISWDEDMDVQEWSGMQRKANVQQQYSAGWKAFPLERAMLMSRMKQRRAIRRSHLKHQKAIRKSHLKHQRRNSLEYSSFGMSGIIFR